MSTLPDEAAKQGDVVDRLGEGLSRICLTIAAIALICIVAINGAHVTSRYLFNEPFSWAEELMLYLMILGVFTGVTAVTWRNMHIRIDTFVDRMPPRLRQATLVIGSVIAIAVIVTAMVSSFQIVALLKSFDQRSVALNFPIWIPQSFIAAGLGLMALVMIVRLVTMRLR